MKKGLAKVILATTVAASGLGLGSLADVDGFGASQVEAAYYADDFNNANFSTIKNLPTDVNLTNLQKRWPAQLNDNIELTTKYNSGDTLVHIKVYKVKSGGVLQRFKTFTPATSTTDSLRGFKATMINDSAYTAGEYVVVTTLKTSSGNLYQLRSNTFQNKSTTWADGTTGWVELAGKAATSSLVYNFANNGTVVKGNKITAKVDAYNPGAPGYLPGINTRLAFVNAATGTTELVTAPERAAGSMASVQLEADTSTLTKGQKYKVYVQFDNGASAGTYVNAGSAWGANPPPLFYTVTIN